MIPLLVCQACFRVFCPPSVPEECPGCGAADGDVEDGPLWQSKKAMEKPDPGDPPERRP